MKYRLPKASTQFIHTPSVCGLLWFGCFGDFRIHHTALYDCALWTDTEIADTNFGTFSPVRSLPVVLAPAALLAPS